MEVIGDECHLDEGWRKSSYSMSNGHCVEFARLADSLIGVRDSKAVDGALLLFALGAWAAFFRSCGLLIPHLSCADPP